MKIKLNKNTIMQLSNDVEVVPQEQTMNIGGAGTRFGCAGTIIPKQGNAAYCDEPTNNACPSAICTQAATCGNTCAATCDDATCNPDPDPTLGCYTSRPRLCEPSIGGGGGNSCLC